MEVLMLVRASQVFTRWFKAYHGADPDSFDASLATVKRILSASFLRPGMQPAMTHTRAQNSYRLFASLLQAM
jgi:hypothetical protein